ncbi:uncharacterized protein LOC143010939 isoform X2 [Genypterus blacodes]|uniref:uncharacterized protein LOC143010939 isoform X2 n=1 Tax=Genypterus blacodes TaxID=154954 RepID=UPI003F758AAC
MDWTLILVLQVLFQPCLSEFFTVVAERNTYNAEFGGEVVMGCRFQPVQNPQTNPDSGLTVTWHWVSNALTREVFRLDNGVENLASQDPEYRGRARLLTEELSGGWAKLQLSKLRIGDSGRYQCQVQRGAADYKSITLVVKAPYRSITPDILTPAEENWKLLRCRSEGFPLSSVQWHDGNSQKLHSNTTSIQTSEKLFQVASQIRVSARDRNNYTCVFTNDGYSETFNIPEDVSTPPARNDALTIALCTSAALLALIVAVLSYRRRKGARCYTAACTENLLENNQANPTAAAACLDKGEEEEAVIINEAVGRGETLGELLRAHYSGFSFNAEARREWGRFCVEELPQKLQNSKGKPVSLQALIPEAGEALLLEGPPESGKTTAAQILVSSWVEGPTHTFSKLLDPSGLQLLFYVDCTKVKGDLYREVRTQLSLWGTFPTEDELGAALCRGGDALLVLDGYREGTQEFDESLRRFLRDRGDCRVLVTACTGHCPHLRETVGTAGLLKLQI